MTFQSVLSSFELKSWDKDDSDINDAVVFIMGGGREIVRI